jgi:broad specificity phosphatase PhoE
MTRLYLVRHGRAAAGWDQDPDPGLDELGRRQAETVADRLSPLADPSPLTVLTSPLRRCRETSHPLAQRWAMTPRVEPAVAEVPSPEGYTMQTRVEWLRAAMRGTWAELGDRYVTFRDGVVAALTSQPDDAVVFSHFIAINAAIGAAIGDDRLVIRSLDNCSVTTLEISASRLVLVEGGHEADTLIR